MSSRRRDQILENCAWLFGHDLHLLTFTQRSPVQPFEQCYYAAVLRKAVSPPQILLQEQHPLSTDGATTKLLATTEAKIGVLLQHQEKNTPAVVPEQTKRFFEALLAKAPVKAVNLENLTEHNLSLLDQRRDADRIAEIERRLQVLDAAVKDLRGGRGPVVTLATSVAPEERAGSKLAAGGGGGSTRELGARAFLFA